MPKPKTKYVTICEECQAPINQCTCERGPTFPDPLNPDPLNTTPEPEEPMICPVCGNEYKV